MMSHRPKLLVLALWGDPVRLVKLVRPRELAKHLGVIDPIH